MSQEPRLREEENTNERTNERKQLKTSKARKVFYGILAIALAVLCFFGGFIVSQMTMDGNIRSLLRLKYVLQTEYYQEITDEEFYDAVFGGINDDLLDPYSKYMTADEYADSQSQAQGNRIGLGISFLTKTATGEDQMRITRVCGNSPAENAGLRIGDSLLGFGADENTITQSVSFTEFSEFIENYDAGEEFCLLVHSNGAQRTVTISKAQFVENYVFYRTSTSAYRFTGENADTLVTGGEPLESLPADTAYIRLTQFNGNAAEQFAKAMQRFQTDGKKNLVLDLRDNGGGYLHILQSIASYFCKSASVSKPTVAVADYGERKSNYNADGNYYKEYFLDDSRICVLADDSTASASEALLGCMLDYGALSYADICLSERSGVAKTYGKGIMQTTFPLGLASGDAVKLTTARILWPKTSNCIHGRGVLPEDGALTVAENDSDEREIAAAIALLFA